MNGNAPVKMHVCSYCGLGAVHSLPGRCPNCGALLTVTVKERATPREIAKVQKDGQGHPS